MTRRREVGSIKSFVLGAALAAGLATAAQADDNKLALSGFATITTDYMFRSISNSEERPAAQAEFDLTYGIFYAGMWGSNTAFGDGIELDYYAGITPKWKNITFNFGGLYYTFPGASEIDYFEALAGATWTAGAWTLNIRDYFSPDNFQFFDESNAIEGSVAYAFSGKLFNFFSPTISGTLGFQSFEVNANDYTYWNAGLTLGFMERWSADVRYYDTDYNDAECFAQSGGRNNCDARVVGAIKATF
ncbi:MAG: TorF family putative porin [Methyloceanibacter sp.]|uniref:TorF family putative porin n=1 Tax=Methyloceanibacter sp. TaxID=1965321 RepID=UPI003D9B6B2B